MIAGAARNPYAVEHLGPFGTSYHFRDEVEDARLFRMLADHRVVALCGPHGSGKSTLLATIAARLRERGERVAMFRCHDWKRRLPVLWLARAARARWVLLDGGEAIHRGELWLLRCFCGLARKRLVLTVHSPQNFAATFEVDAGAGQLRRLVQHLGGRKSMAECEELLRRHQGDARRALFELYDGYEAEAMRRAGRQTAAPTLGRG